MNRAAVYLLAAVVRLGVAVVGGGVYVLLGDGGDAGTGTPTAVDATPLPLTPTPTPTAQADTATRTTTPAAAATSTAVGSPTETAVRTSILPRRFDQRRIEVLVVEAINERRTGEGLDALTGNETVAARLRAMARDHSVAMADEGAVRHKINGSTGVKRYQENDLDRLCRWEAVDKEAIISPNRNGYEQNHSALEAVGRTYAGRTYGDGQFNEDERAVAEALVDRFFSDYRFARRLLLPGATHVGVGVEITQSGEVYVTADLCNPT